MKYVYCLTRDDPSTPKVFPSGLGGAGIYSVSSGGISALISDLGSWQLTGSEENAVIHQAVVNAALRLSRSIIPCRFGTLFPDDKKILTFLREHYARLDAQLTKLEGKAEVGIQSILNWKTTIKAEIPDKLMMAGVDYLLRKKEQFDAIEELEADADELARKLNQATFPFWSDVKARKRVTGERLLLSLCYLVDGHKLASFRQAYQRFKGENPDLKLLYTGPWPPYSFTDIDLRKDKEQPQLQ